MEIEWKSVFIFGVMLRGFAFFCGICARPGNQFLYRPVFLGFENHSMVDFGYNAAYGINFDLQRIKNKTIFSGFQSDPCVGFAPDIIDDLFIHSCFHRSEVV